MIKSVIITYHPTMSVSRMYSKRSYALKWRKLNNDDDDDDDVI